jgi:DNA-binding XRE family transcriptional regulator
MPIREAGRVHARARVGPRYRPPQSPFLVARTKAKLTRLAVATKAGVDYATLWRIETGRVFPHRATTAAVLAAIRDLSRHTKKGRR